MPFIGNLGPTEMIFVMLILLVVFGAKRLPELGAGLGKGIREFKRSMREINNDIERAAEDQKEIKPPAPPAQVAARSETETTRA